MIVHVLMEENDNGNCNTAFCHGVYYTFEDAKKAKYTMIRDQYHIPEDEVSNKDLDDEIYPSGVYYTIVQREVK
jgi:hypothetical protein